jgi:hypothetical protein
MITILFVFFLLILSGCGLLENNTGSAELRIGDGVFQVEVAGTPREKAIGLSGRDGLAEDAGMLFVYEEADRYSFWMKDMNFPLDFIWINGDRVVDLDKNITPENVQPPKTISPKVKADKVLEVEAGSVEKYNIETGDRVQLF